MRKTIDFKEVRSTSNYYLLGKKIHLILNPRKEKGNIYKIIRGLSKNFPLDSFKVVLSAATKISSDLKRETLSKDSLLIAIGGDESANNAAQYVVRSPAVLGLIPRGDSNVLANYFRIPKKQSEAFKVIANGRFSTIDTLKLNAHHLLTIGCIGFPATAVHAFNRLKATHRIGKYLDHRILKSVFCKIFALSCAVFKGKSALLHHARVTVDENPFFEGDCVAVFFGKQPFLGSSLCPLPQMKHSDPFVMISVLQFTGIRQLLKDAYYLYSGRPEFVKNLITTSGQNFHIETEKFQHLLGDGEILDFDDEFNGKRIPQSLRLLVPS